jgi:hypothetical protein
MVEERFFGLVKCPGGQLGHCVSIDGLGQQSDAAIISWSAERLRQLLGVFKHYLATHDDLDITVAVVAGEMDDEMITVLLKSDLDVRVLQPRVVDAMWRCMHRKKHTGRMRALCVAQLLLLADWPPVPLSPAHRTNNSSPVARSA